MLHSISCRSKNGALHRKNFDIPRVPSPIIANQHCAGASQTANPYVEVPKHA